MKTKTIYQVILLNQKSLYFHTKNKYKNILKDNIELILKKTYVAGKCRSSVIYLNQKYNHVHVFGPEYGLKTNIVVSTKICNLNCLNKLKQTLFREDILRCAIEDGYSFFTIKIYSKYPKDLNKLITSTMKFEPLKEYKLTSIVEAPTYTDNIQYSPFSFNPVPISIMSPVWSK